MRRALGATGLVAALAAAGLVGPRAAPGAGPAPRTHEIQIRGMAFEPADVRARPGDTLVWVNRDLVPHTATRPDSAWSSPPLAPGGRFRLVVDSSSGGAYLCAFHPTMEGRVTIGGDGDGAGR